MGNFPEKGLSAGNDAAGPVGFSSLSDGLSIENNYYLLSISPKTDSFYKIPTKRNEAEKKNRKDGSNISYCGVT